MKKYQAIDLLKRLAEQFVNMLADQGFEVGADVVECPHSEDGLHIVIFDSNGVEMVQYHLWDPGDDFPENMYLMSFRYIAQQIGFVLTVSEELKKLMEEIDNPFGWFKDVPYHGGLLN